MRGVRGSGGNYPHWAGYPSRRAFLAYKRAQSKKLLRALADFRLGCAYLPPAAECDGGEAISKIEAWIKGPCRAAWRKA